MKLYVVRHGQTVWNADNRICGQTDIELDETGILQAQALGRDKKLDEVDIIITSPLKRACRTARFIKGDRDIPIITDIRLTEQNYGIYEGMDRGTPGFLENKTNFAYNYPGGGESMLRLGHRIYSLLEDLKEKYPGKTLLLVCHGGVCRMIRTYFQDMTNKEFAAYSPDNCSLAEYDM